MYIVFNITVHRVENLKRINPIQVNINSIERKENQTEQWKSYLKKKMKYKKYIYQIVQFHEKLLNTKHALKVLKVG